jgi:sialate O-acetylesterase
MKRIYQIIFLLTFCFLVTSAGIANAEVKLPRLIADGMVLQRNEPVRIWGWADPSEKVKVSLLGETYRAKADAEGNWQMELPAMEAGGPYTLKVNGLEITNVMVGEVWLASGQSNMELPIRRVMDLYADEINRIDNPQIRLFRSSTREDFREAQADYPDGEWNSATPENIGEFAAVAYFFADQLYQKYNVPVGIISTAIGGSPAESWLSENKAKPYLEEWMKEKTRKDSLRAIWESERGEEPPFNWADAINENDPGVGRWSQADVDVSDWPVMSVPGYWNDKGVDLRQGSMWFCREFEVADSLLGKEAVLRLGRIIDSDSAFVNGTFVGTVGYQYPPRIYDLPKGVLKEGKNKVMVRIISQGWRGGFVEEKPYEVRFENATVDLTGDWKYHEGARVSPPEGMVGGMSFMPGGLYNGLISPATNYTLQGVIWYQGESNAGRGKEYRELFQNLIKDWRKEFDAPELPFLYVQLANLGIPSKQPVESGWSDLQESQRKALELPQTGMAVTYDVGEWNDIHPLNKKEVGRRLALEAFRVAYGDSSVVSSGPLYESMSIHDNSIHLEFEAVGSGLYANSLLNGFQIAGEDGSFVWARAVVLNKNTVKVWSDKVKNPQAVRYAWEGNPEGANLKNKEGLPASPFMAVVP